MVCVQCQQKTQVINSRPQRRTNQQWRRRQCTSCNAVFSTIEAVDYSAVWRVKRPSGELVPFNRDKLLLSITYSLEHRPKSLEDASGITNTVISKLQSTFNNGTLTTKQIIQAVQVALNRFDKAGSVHYQANHSIN